jgi:hypothetical protein
MVRPEAVHSVTRSAAAPLAAATAAPAAVPASAATGSGASIRTETDRPVASAICDASVRFQISS